MGRSERNRGIMPGEYKNPYASTRKSGAYNRRGRRIADELEAQVEEKTMFGQLPRSVNTNLAAYDESVTLPGVFGDLRGGSGDIKSEPPKSDPNPPAPKPDITVTSPNTGNMPTSWAEYEKFLKSKSIHLANAREQTTGFESNDLPAGSEPITPRKLFQQDGVEFDKIFGGKLLQGDMTAPQLKGLGTGQAENYNPDISGVDPQAGASPLPAESDQSRSIKVDQSKNRALPRGARQREMFLRQNPSYGRPEAPEIEKGSGLSARSRAFLDYEGNSLNALRAADASQNLMRYGDKYGVKGADGKITEISRDGANAIRSGDRNQSEFTQDFLKHYITTPAKPADSQSSHSISPPATSKDPVLSSMSSQDGIYTNLLNMGKESIPGFTQKDREPLMRFTDIKY